MSAQMLNRLGGIVVLVTAVLTAVGGLLVFFTREQGMGSPVIPQMMFSAAILLAVFALTAIYLPQATRGGKLGFIGYVLAAGGNALSIAPAFIWLAVTQGAAWGHEALMFSWWGGVPVLPIGTYASIVGYICLGIATARAGIYPHWAGRLLVIGALLDLPVELPMIGGMFMILWPFSLIALSSAIGWIGWTLVAGKHEAVAHGPAIAIPSR